MLLSQILLNRRADEYDEHKDGAAAAKIKDFYLEDDGDGAPAFSEQNKEKIVQMFGDAFCFGGERILENGCLLLLEELQFSYL